MDAGINPIKQNLNIKQYIGWVLAVFLPFSIKSIADYTKAPLIAMVLYWIICGIILRFLMHKKLPYFNLDVKSVKKEMIALIIVSFIAIYFYFIGSVDQLNSTNEMLIYAILFGLLNGCFEQLVWVNILDFAGARVKLNGFIAVFIYIILINALFWNKFIPIPNIHTSLFVVVQIILAYIPLVIYIKTEDITLWTIQRIIYNLIIIFIGTFGTNLSFHG